MAGAVVRYPNSCHDMMICKSANMEKDEDWLQDAYFPTTNDNCGYSVTQNGVKIGFPSVTGEIANN